MPVVNVGLSGTATINTSGIDSVSFLGIGTLNIAGPAGAPIAVTLAQVAGVGLLDTVNITNANATLQGVAGVSALTAYNIGLNGTLTLASTIGLAVGSTITFTGTNSELVLGAGINLAALSAIGGFALGSTIDATQLGATSATYASNAAPNTGGILTLLNASGVALGTVALATGTFTTANFLISPDGSGGTLIQIGAGVTGVIATPPTADLGVGQTVALNVATSDSVTVAGGTPTLTLNDGGTATYNAAASTAKNLVFTYTVAAGQNTPDLAITAANLNGATITASSGAALSLNGAVTNPAGILQIDTTAPTITTVSANPANADLGLGATATFTLAISKPVTVLGLPTLTLNDGGTAIYNPLLSTPTSLVFTTIIAAGQNTPDLTVTAANLNGGSILDAAGNAANLTGAGANPVGILQVDTTAPTITGITATPANADLGLGATATLTLAISKPVTVLGVPTLTLNDGGTAIYNALLSTPTSLVFTTIIAAGQNTPDLAVTAANLNGGTILDAAGNPASLAGAIANPAGILQVDTTIPAVAAITTNPASGTIGAGQTVAITLATTKPVLVSGTPTLTLNDGGMATYNAAASTPTSLVFTYTAASGQNTAALAVTAVNLGGTTVTDAAGNPANLAGALGAAGSLAVNTIAPTVTAVTTTPLLGDLGVGATATLTLTTSKPVTISGGTPTLTLNDGGTATYNAAASTSTSLVFTTTIAAGQNTPDLAATAINLNGATVADASGNVANLAGAIAIPIGTLQVDTIAATITGITATPANADLGIGGTATLTLTTSKAVIVAGGTPTLTLNDGGIATYNALLSTPTSLVFTYTAATGQNTPDLAVTAANLNGATIKDAAGNPASLAGAVANPAGTLQVDTTTATVTAITTNPASGTIGAGQTAAITLATTKPVLVIGTPTLTLNDGGTATYNALLSTPTSLVFTYTAAPGQNTAALAVTAANLNGGTILDAAGNPANLAGVVGSLAGTLGVNTTTPFITSVTTNPAGADLGVGATATLTLGTTGPLTITGGTPTLTLNDGGTATYNALLSTPTSLVFTTTIAAGQNTPDLAATAINLNGATVADASGNVANLTGALAIPTGTLQVDTTIATVTGITTNPASGTIGAGQTVTIDIATTKPVTVTGGTPTLTLNDGGTATYNPTASTAGTLAFTYTAIAGQNTAALAVTALNLGGATVADAAGNLANLAGAVGTPAGSLGVNTATPIITSVVATPAGADLGVGGVATLTLISSMPVFVTGGTPTLTLNDGGTATYNALLSTPTSLVFTTTIAARQNTAGLAAIGVNLPAGTIIADLSGNALNLAGALATPAGTVMVDTTPATITAVAVTSPAGSDIGVGATATFTLTSSKPLTVIGGTPTLTLNDGGTATYNALLSTPTSLVFTTTIGAGQNTAGLAATAVNLHTASIADAAGNLANLAGALATPTGTVMVDTTAPTITGITATPANADLGIGATATLTVTMSKAVTITGGIPTLTLNDGGTATYNALLSTPTSLVFTYTATTGQNTPDLAVTAANPNASIITDVAGNQANLAGAFANPAGILQIDTTIATVTSVTTTPGSGALGIGQPISITVDTSKPVTVAGGTPTLTLNDGAAATYNAAASTPTALVFTTVVAAGQSAPDLATTAVNLNGATVSDAAGNPADLAGAITNPPGVLQVAGIKPTLALTANPSSADIGIGQLVVFNVAASAPLTVAGGTPTLTLNDGGTATYDPTASTPTNLVFTYTAAAGQNTPDLAVITANLNSATIADANGNAPDLSTIAVNPTGTLQVDTTTATVTGVITNPASGTVTTGQTVAITVTTSKPVTVSGGIPTLTLNDGGTATYNPTASTPGNLVFTTTIAAGQSSPDLAITAESLNGATVTDAAGNPADLSGAVTTPPGNLQVGTGSTGTGMGTGTGTGPGTGSGTGTGIHPFTTLVASSPDPSAQVTVTIVLSPVVPGTFSNLGTGTLAADGNTYSVTGTASQVNTALAGVLLNPNAGAPTPAGYFASISSANPAAPPSLTDTGTASSDLTAQSVGDTLVAGSGNDTLIAGASDNSLYGGSGNDVLIGNAAGSTLTGGSGSSMLISGGGTTRMVGEGAADTISGVLGNVTIVTATKGHSLVATGAGASIVDSQGSSDTIVGGTGSEIIGTADASLVFLGSGPAIVFSAPNTTVVGGAGADTVGVNGPGMLFYAGSGPSTFIGGTGTSTVIGGVGSQQTVFAASGGGLFGAGSGGNNILVGGQQATTLFGGGSGDQLFAVGSGGTQLVAGAGNETLAGTLSSGTDVYFAGAGTAQIALGTGTDLVEAGTGSATVYGGTGVDSYGFAKGAGGQVTILNFKVGTDHLVLQGFGATEVQNDLATATLNVATAAAPASTTFTLSDNTRITIYNVAADPRLFT